MPVLGLTGTFGSGKTTAAGMFQSFGAIVIDADKIAREVVSAESDALREIIKTFGNQVLLPNGSLDRKKLGSIVFGNDEKLKCLNQIIHPRVRKRELDLLAKYENYPLVVLNVPLLLENRMESLVDRIAVVAISDEKQFERLRKRDNIGADIVQQVLRTQWSQEQKLQKADFIINNDGTLEELKRQVREIVKQIAPTLLE